MGRKRKEKTKKRITLSVDEDLIHLLEEDGVNKSRLFTLASRKYLRKKRRLLSKDR